MAKPKKTPIEAKPTTYRGKHCRSKLEARWAVFLDYQFNVNQWDHEPHKYTLDNGWDYTPDFIFKAGPWQGFIEVKPAKPSKEYMEVLKTFVEVLPFDLWLAVGDFYKGVPTIQNLSQPGGEKYRLDKVPFFPSSDDAIKTAKTFRFDLEHPVPPFRKGNTQRARGFRSNVGGKQSRARDAQGEALRKPKKKGPS